MSNDSIDLDLEIFIQVLDKFGTKAVPALRIQKYTCEPQQMRKLAILAIQGQTIPVKIKIKDRWKAALKLVKLEILSQHDIERLF